MTKADIDSISPLIHRIRSTQIMLDSDLADLYGVPTKALLQAVRRNIERFPRDFMFPLTRKEAAYLRSQFVTSNWGGRRHTTYAFTEQGVAMLSSVLKSRRAVQMNIAIMRVFVKIKKVFSVQKNLARKLEQLENKIETHDREIEAIFEAIRQLINTPAERKKKIGFTAD